MRPLFFIFEIIIYVLCWTSYPVQAGPSLSRLLGLEQSISAAGNELRTSILASEQALMRIETEFDQDVEDRFNQLDEIVSSALDRIDVLRKKGKIDAGDLLNRADEILRQAIINARDLEGEINQNLHKLIFESECAVKRTLQEAIPETFGGIGSLFVKNIIIITPPPIYEGERREFCFKNCRIEKRFEILQPYSTTYFEVRDYLLGRLDEMPDNGPINTVVSTYEFLSAFARRAACFVPGSEQRYIAEHIKYKTVVERWTNILGPGLGMEK